MTEASHTDTAAAAAAASLEHIAVLLDQMCAQNDAIVAAMPRPPPLTRFHSKTIPPISTADYLRRIVRYGKIQYAALLMLPIYMDRFMIAALTVANKAVSDVYMSNSLMAVCGGISVSELALLEAELLRMLDWCLQCQPETLESYRLGLQRIAQRQLQQQQPESSDQRPHYVVVEAAPPVTPHAIPRIAQRKSVIGAMGCNVIPSDLAAGMHTTNMDIIAAS